MRRRSEPSRPGTDGRIAGRGEGPPDLPPEAEDVSAGKPTQEGNGIDLSPVAPDLEMEVGAGGVSRVPAEADHLPVLDLFACTDVNGREVGVDGNDLPLMIQPDDLPKPPLGACKTNTAPCHGPNLGPVGYVDVHSPVQTQ